MRGEWQSDVLLAVLVVTIVTLWVLARLLT